ncbi:hypothetical protein KKH56_07120 [bacterium]|nr:hypothetical protein [bacterium]
MKLDDKTGSGIGLDIGTLYQTNGLSLDEGPGVTAGFGVTYKNLTFDGAYVPAGDLSETFRLSASMRF